MFSGIGGFELGFQESCNSDKPADQEPRKAEPDQDMSLRKREIISEVLRDERRIRHIGQNGRGFLSGDRRRQRPVCLGYSEVDRYAIQVYAKHFPTHRNYGDATRIDPRTLPDFDLLCGGFPCQAFSIAGKRRGFDDTRGTLFFDIARILEEKRPRLLLLENVKGLLSHDHGRTFKTIITTLAELGYDLQWQVLNSKNFGVPQNRERVFIVGHLGGTPRPQVFPVSGDGSENYRTDRKIELGGTTDTGHVKSQRQSDLTDICATPLQFLERNWRNCQREYSFTADTAQAGGVTADSRIRRLTPVECERLQGFPDGWTEGISDTQRYKCLGNAVTVNVIKEIAKRML